MRAVLALLGVLGLGGCRGAETNGVYWALERMVVQPRYEPYGESRFFPDGRAMQRPPEGTVPRGAPIGRPALTEGRIDGRYIERIPVPVTPALMAMGRLRFDITCAACHGLLGDGASPVAMNMELRPPPPLHTPRLRAFPPGRLYAIVREGYGLMPSYADMLSVEERWAVVAYLRALQLSQFARLAELPAAVRAEALRALGRPGAPASEGSDD